MGFDPGHDDEGAALFVEVYEVGLEGIVAPAGEAEFFECCGGGGLEGLDGGPQAFGVLFGDGDGEVQGFCCLQQDLGFGDDSVGVGHGREEPVLNVDEEEGGFGGGEEHFKSQSVSKGLRE